MAWRQGAVYEWDLADPRTRGPNNLFGPSRLALPSARHSEAGNILTKEAAKVAVMWPRP